MSQQAIQERYFGDPKISFLVQKRSSLLKRTHISNTCATDFHYIHYTWRRISKSSYTLWSGKNSFYAKQLYLVAICSNTQPWFFKLAFSNALMACILDEIGSYYLNRFSDMLVMHINPLSRARQIFCTLFDLNTRNGVVIIQPIVANH